MIKKYFGWIFLAAIHILFFCLALYLKHIHVKDSYEYLQQAINLRTHGSWYCGDLNLPIDSPLFSQRPPLYGTFLSLTYWPSVGEWLPLLLQGIFSFYNCIIAVLLFELIAERKVKVFGFFLPIIFFASQFIYANMIMSEILFQTSWMLAIYFAVRFLKSYQKKDLVFHQLAMTASLLIKPIAFAFPVISTLGLIILANRNKIPSKFISSALIPVVAIMMILSVNYKNTSVIEFSSIGRKLMINYNIPLLLAKQTDAKAADAIVDSVQRISYVLPYPDRAKYIDQQCLHWIMQSPGSYLMLHVKGFFRFFLDHGRWDLYNFLTGVNTDTGSSNTLQQSYQQNGFTGAGDYITAFPKSVVIYLILTVIMNLFLLIYFIRFLFLKDINKYFRILFAVMVFYIAILTGPTGGSRFRVPVYPVLLVTFAMMVSQDRRRIALKLKL